MFMWGVYLIYYGNHLLYLENPDEVSWAHKKSSKVDV